MRRATTPLIARTQGSRAHWHPHLHLLVTDGGFRPDGTFVSWPAHDRPRLTKAFRRAVLSRFVRLELSTRIRPPRCSRGRTPEFTCTRPVWVPEDNRVFATRLARYCARNPVALEFLARVLVHIPDEGHVTTRYSGWYANHRRGMRKKVEPAATDGAARDRPHADRLHHLGLGDRPRLNFLSRPPIRSCCRSSPRSFGGR